jgi:hypothetical protein
MNLVARQVYGNKKGNVWNTSIGGVSATISTASALATKLNISVGTISNFTVVGSDINCRITGNYVIPTLCFQNNTAITNYIDSDGLVSDILTNAFDGTTLIKEVNFKGIISLTGDAVFRLSNLSNVYLENCTFLGNRTFASAYNMKIIYAPRCVTLGSTTGAVLGEEKVFYSTYSGTVIYLADSLRTVNGGNPDNDIIYAISQGATIRYVTNFTKPLTPVINSATGYKTYVNLSISTTSTNAIDYYELYSNGVFIRTILPNGFIDDLANLTSYNFSVIAVDIFYNKSLISSAVSASTTTTSLMPLTGLISYYKLSEASGTTAVDKVGTNNGTYVLMNLLQSGKVGYGVKGAGNSYVNLNSNTITGGKTAFSVSMWFKIASTGNVNYLYGSWNGAQSSLLIRLSGGNLQFFTYTTSQVGGSMIAFSDTTNFHHLVCTYDGATMKMYLDGAVSATNFARTGIMNIGTATERIGDAQGVGSPNSFDETAIYSRALTQAEVTTIYNGGNALTL